MASNESKHDPVHGADPLVDGFEVGFNEDFENSWLRTAWVGRGFMLLFVLICLGGLLGRGPFSHASARSSDGALQVDYEPVARNGTATLVTLHLRNRSADALPLSLRLSSNLVEPMGYQRSIPIPDRSTVEAGGMRFDYMVAPGQDDELVRLALQPTGIGPVDLSARLGDGPRVTWSQFVAP